MEEIHEFQTAYAFEPDNQFAQIKNYCQTLNINSSVKAKGIPVLPEEVNIDFIEQYVTKGSLSIPIGVETASLEINYFDLSKNYISFVQSESREYDGFVSTLSTVLSSLSDLDTTIIDAANLTDNVSFRQNICQAKKKYLLLLKNCSILFSKDIIPLKKHRNRIVNILNIQLLYM